MQSTVISSCLEMYPSSATDTVNSPDSKVKSSTIPSKVEWWDENCWDVLTAELETFTDAPAIGSSVVLSRIWTNIIFFGWLVQYGVVVVVVIVVVVVVIVVVVVVVGVVVVVVVVVVDVVVVVVV